MLDAKTIERLNETLKTSIDRQEIAGANLMIIRGGAEQYYHEDGLADREAGTPIRRDSIFRLYSMTKPVTATAVMLLLERGAIDLFDPVGRYLPGFRNQQVAKDGELVPTERDMTLYDLLNMTSGLVYGGPGEPGRQTEALFREIDERLLGDSPLGTVEAMNRLGECPLAFQPGASWQYGTSADVLAAVVEVVGGMSFGEFLRRELFEPLGMTDTGFWLPGAKRGRLAKTYAADGPEGLELYEGNHLGIVHQMDREPAFQSGGAGLVSTIDDAARFTTMLLREGSLDGVRLLRPATVRYMTSSKLTLRQRQAFSGWHTLRGHGYGNQMRIMTDSRKAGILGSDGEYGWDGWLGAYFCNSPQDDLTFLFMTQRKDAGTLPITRKLRNIVFSSL
ncbi:serine hydrolase domain-containing protein [Cohnella fermenti]|uniref:Beta-lactamase family protein n=1 Tax=Cohnella fermenti TaxID=2565925 RepID=A0A4S4BLR7_9BACL|nr:serine hydrolase domain-containing protein [Cohnella fermenti]THF75713.1 beta-lactamase family protein [Cohnella fermenti]